MNQIVLLYNSDSKLYPLFSHQILRLHKENRSDHVGAFSISFLQIHKLHFPSCFRDNWVLSPDHRNWSVEVGVTSKTGKD